MMKKLLVHLHLYYQDMWPEFKKYIKNISSYDYDLFVTIVKHNTTLEQDILSLVPNAHIILCENRGFDIRPFIQIVQKVSLDDYSYIIKLHTKGDSKIATYLDKYRFVGKEWREASCHFMSSEKRIAHVIKILETNKRVGMCGNHMLFMKNEISCDPNALQRCAAIVQKNKLGLMPYTFIAGTIFIVRAKIFTLLQCIDIDAFEVESRHLGQYAHAVERFFGYCVAHHGLKIYDPLISKKELCKKILWYSTISWKIRRFLFLYERNKKGIMRFKICRIPIPLFIVHLFIKKK